MGWFYIIIVTDIYGWGPLFFQARLDQGLDFMDSLEDDIPKVYALIEIVERNVVQSITTLITLHILFN